MKSRTRRIWLSVIPIVAGAVIAACSGGSTITPNPAAPAALISSVANPTLSSQRLTIDAKHKKHGRAQFVIRIPRKKKPGRRMHPEYVSPSTQSMKVAVQGGTTYKFNLTASSPGCTTDPTSGAVTCQEGVYLPSGQQTLTVTLYDLQNGYGDQLATATTSVTIAPTGITTIPITLDGVVATATVLIDGMQTGAGIPVGKATSVPVTVEAYDAQGNLIIPPGNYSSPITLTNSDPTGITSFTPPAPASRRTKTTAPYAGKGSQLKPFDTTTINAPGASQTLYYNGGFLMGELITPSVGGVSQPSGVATLAGTGNPIVAQYPLNISATNEFGDMTLGPDGAIWFTASGALGRITTGGNITEYSLAGSYPWQIVVGSDGALWFTDQSDSNSNQIGRITTSGTITEYSVGGDFGVENMIEGPDGAVWFAGFELGLGRITTNGSITEYTTGGSVGDVMVDPDGKTLDIVGNNGNVNLVKMTTSGTVSATIDIAPYEFSYVWGGKLWGNWPCDGGAEPDSISTTGTDGTCYPVAESPTGVSASAGGGRVIGPDGAQWTFFGSSSPISYYGRFAADGTSELFALPQSVNIPFNCAGPGTFNPCVSVIGPAPTYELYTIGISVGSNPSVYILGIL